MGCFCCLQTICKLRHVSCLQFCHVAQAVCVPSRKDVSRHISKGHESCIPKGDICATETAHLWGVSSDPELLHCVGSLLAVVFVLYWGEEGQTVWRTLPRKCNRRADQVTGSGHQQLSCPGSHRFLSPTKNKFNLDARQSEASLPEIKLIRTDTTLDLSHFQAEKMPSLTAWWPIR